MINKNSQDILWIRTKRQTAKKFLKSVMYNNVVHTIHTRTGCPARIVQKLENVQNS